MASGVLIKEFGADCDLMRDECESPYSAHASSLKITCTSPLGSDEHSEISFSIVMKSSRI